MHESFEQFKMDVFKKRCLDHCIFVSKYLNGLIDDFVLHIIQKTNTSSTLLHLIETEAYLLIRAVPHWSN